MPRCAAPFVIAAYPKVRCSPHDLCALSANSYEAAPIMAIYEFIKNLQHQLGIQHILKQWTQRANQSAVVHEIYQVVRILFQGGTHDSFSTIFVRRKAIFIRFIGKLRPATGRSFGPGQPGAAGLSHGAGYGQDRSMAVHGGTVFLDGGH
jgi:hypothetical protein